MGLSLRLKLVLNLSLRFSLCALRHLVTPKSHNLCTLTAVSVAPMHSTVASLRRPGL